MGDSRNKGASASEYNGSYWPRQKHKREREKLLFGSHTLTKHRGIGRLNGIAPSPVKHMASSVFGALFVALLGDEDGDGEHKLPPGSPPTCMSTVLWTPFSLYSQLHNSEVWRSLVHDSAHNFSNHRCDFVSAILVLQNPMASPLCPENETQRSVEPNGNSS